MNRAKSEADYFRVRDYVLELVNEDKLLQGRLPTERDLSDRLGVGRGVTRRVLGEFEAQGLIRRHVGRGTFVGGSEADERQSNGVVSPPWAANTRSPAAYIEARLRFEPELAWTIVVQATAADFDLIHDLLRRSEAANTMVEFEACDGDFHAALVNATHNSLLIDMYRVIDDVRRLEHAKWSTVHGGEQTAQQREIFIKEHNEIFEALVKRDGRGARNAWSDHIRQTKRRILDL